MRFKTTASAVWCFPELLPRSRTERKQIGSDASVQIFSVNMQVISVVRMNKQSCGHKRRTAWTLIRMPSWTSEAFVFSECHEALSFIQNDILSYLTVYRTYHSFTRGLTDTVWSDSTW